MDIKRRTVRVAKEFKKQTIVLLLGSFGLVAALAWNDAIKAIIERVFPLGVEAVWAKLIYAVVFTLVLVLVTLILLRPPDEDEEEAKKEKA